MSPPAPAEPGEAECVVSGPASGVYLFLWNRSDARRCGRLDHGRHRLPGRLAVERTRPLELTQSA